MAIRKRVYLSLFQRGRYGDPVTLLLFGIYLFAFYPFQGLPQGLVEPLTLQACLASLYLQAYLLSLLNTLQAVLSASLLSSYYLPRGIDPGDIYHACYTVFRLGSGAHKDPSHLQ